MNKTNVSEDFKWFGITTDTMFIEVDGKANFKSNMESYFKSLPGGVQSTVDKIELIGNKISFEETVSYKNKEGKTISASAMGIYEIKEDKIYRVWYFY